MTEYIERGEAEKRLFQRAEIANSAYIDQNPYQIMMLAQNVVHLIPAADVRPVVLCRDCKHSDTFVPDCTEATFPLKCLSIRYGGVYPNWFCEHGEKREES